MNEHHIHFADSMSVWNLLREFRIRKVHMAVVLNEYGGTIGVRIHIQFKGQKCIDMCVYMCLEHLWFMLCG